MHLDVTWSITAIIAACSLISPILVAMINNRHHTKIRQMELSHDESMRQFEIYYADKKTAFSNFLNAAGRFSSDKSDLELYGRLQSLLNKALLFANAENQKLLCDFLTFIDTEAFAQGHSSDLLSTYSNELNSLARSLNQELESSKPKMSKRTPFSTIRKIARCISRRKR